jgi:hypothetical protein
MSKNNLREHSFDMIYMISMIFGEETGITELKNEHWG